MDPHIEIQFNPGGNVAVYYMHRYSPVNVNLKSVSDEIAARAIADAVYNLALEGCKALRETIR